MNNLPPISSPTGAGAPLTSHPHDDILALARAQKWVLLGVLGNVSTALIALLVASAAPNLEGGVGVGLALFNIVRMIIAVAVAVATWNLGRALKYKAAWLWALLSLVPLLGLVVLLVLNSRATHVLKEAGYQVGLMGAKIS